MSTSNPTPVVRPYLPTEPRAPLRRFWYDTYVTEMQRDLDRADHERCELPDTRERTGWIIAALLGERVVGTVICTPCRRGNMGQYKDLYRLNKLGEGYVQNTGIITKLMVAPKYRSSPVTFEMCRELYRFGVPKGVNRVVIDCNDYLVPFFKRLGFTQWIDPVVHPSYGRVNVLQLDCLDLEHLERVRSPILGVARDIAPALITTHQSNPTGVPA